MDQSRSVGLQSVGEYCSFYEGRQLMVLIKRSRFLKGLVLAIAGGVVGTVMGIRSLGANPASAVSKVLRTKRYLGYTLGLVSRISMFGMRQNC